MADHRNKSLLTLACAVALACSSSVMTDATNADTTPIRDGTLYMSATASGDGSSISVLAVIENRKNSDIVLSPDFGCPFDVGPLQLAVYRDETLSRRAYWGQGEPAPTPGQVCPAYGYFYRLEPGMRKQFHLTVSSAAILGDSLPSGVYTIRVSGAWIAAEVAGEIPLGNFMLKK